MNHTASHITDIEVSRHTADDVCASAIANRIKYLLSIGWSREDIVRAANISMHTFRKLQHNQLSEEQLRRYNPGARILAIDPLAAKDLNSSYITGQQEFNKRVQFLLDCGLSIKEIQRLTGIHKGWIADISYPKATTVKKLFDSWVILSDIALARSGQTYEGVSDDN